MLAELIVVVGLGFFIAPILALIATPIFCLMRKIWYVPFTRDKILKKAIAQGHIVQAKLIRSGSYLEDGPIGADDLTRAGYRATYEYQWHGRSYKYEGQDTTTPPEELTLYFQTKPGKACTASALGNRESRWFLYFLFLCVLFYFVCLILGLIYINR